MGLLAIVLGAACSRLLTALVFGAWIGLGSAALLYASRFSPPAPLELGIAFATKIIAAALGFSVAAIWRRWRAQRSSE